MPTRQALDEQLNALQAELSRRVTDNPDDLDLLPWINSERDRLIEAAGDEHREYVRSQIDCMEAFEGLIPGDDTGERCRPGAPSAT